MKKILSILVICITVFSLSACGGSIESKALKAIDHYKSTHYVYDFFVDKATVYNFVGFDDEKYNLMFMEYTEKDTGYRGFFMVNLEDGECYDSSDFAGTSEETLYNSIGVYMEFYESSLNGYIGLEALNDTVEVTELSREELSKINEELF